MQSKKDRRNKLYEVNKLHKQEQRKNLIKKQENNEINVIKNMSHEQLLAFLENKYEKFIKNNEELEHKVNYLLAAAIEARTKQFEKEIREYYVNFLVQNGGKVLNDEQYDRVIRRGNLYLPKDSHLTWTNQEGFQVMNVITNYTCGQKRSAPNKFVCQNLPEYLRIQIDMKRAKKECVKFLENIIEYKNKVYGIIY